ncbi:MAG: hypothetical protein JJE46_02905 [Acidimicrobiia bacterium]|nr:hypothetical protein [Acidimicrobiia bacterium]
MVSRVLANPLVGLSPWILYSIVEGNGRLELSAALALGLALTILFLNWIHGGTPKLLEYSDVAYFAGLAVVVAFAGPATRHWLELWGGEVANVALLTIALGSIVLRMPFTLPYAREDSPEEIWHTPEFLRVNYLIAWVWVLAFGIEALSGLIGDAVLHNADNIWTGWIIQTLPLIIAAQFTIWYPNRLEALRDGRVESAPTVRDFYGTVTPWITIVGIITLSVDGAPEIVGIGLIAAGILLTRSLTSKPGGAPALRSDG